jgi:glutaredoxin-like protein NrdH
MVGEDLLEGELIILYSKANCVQCTQTKKMLDQLTVEYKVIDLTTSESDYKYVTEELGYKSAPVVIVFNAIGGIAKSWAGFNPELIKEWCSEL